MTCASDMAECRASAHLELRKAAGKKCTSVFLSQGLQSQQDQQILDLQDHHLLDPYLLQDQLEFCLGTIQITVHLQDQVPPSPYLLGQLPAAQYSGKIVIELRFLA